MAGVSLALIVGVMDIINFAHGEFLMLGMYAAFWGFSLLHFSPYTSLLLGLPLFYLFGIFLYSTIVKRIVHKPHFTMVCATLGLSIFLQNSVLLLWGGKFRSIKTVESMTKVWDILGLRLPSVKLISVLFVFAATVLFYLFLNRTMHGKAVRAVSQCPTGADLVGIDRTRIFRLAFAIGTVLAAFAGVLYSTMYPMYPTVGAHFVLLAYVIVILGGLGSITGAVVGGLIIGLVESLSGYFLAPNLKQIVYYMAFVVILLVRPQGLFGRGQT